MAGAATVGVVRDVGGAQPVADPRPASMISATSRRTRVLRGISAGGPALLVMTAKDRHGHLTS
ncbi:hypothetical protein BJF90_38740 [Pseudonocardia sp. CNS-004]|nr:hypothetical protein BJF90_38740 [Pseudonocardia sp. CNS-004]